MKKIEVLLADVHTVVRQGLRVLLEAAEDIKVVAEAENGRQAVVMAPTEILAEQHYRNFGKLLAGMDIPVRILTASTKGAQRREVLDLLRGGVSAIVVGTHALLEEEVEFERLSLVVIDEQHRFGVRQRMSLMRKSEQPRKRGDTNKRVSNAKLHQLGWTPDYPTFRDAMEKSILPSFPDVVP